MGRQSHLPHQSAHPLAPDFIPLAPNVAVLIPGSTSVRLLLKRASFASVEQLKERVLSFIEYFNRTMAKPFKWTYTGKALVA